MVRLGVDGLSRESGVDEGDLRTGPLARAGLSRLCASFGWQLSIDLFASPENSLCPRFCARFQTLHGETWTLLHVDHGVHTAVCVARGMVTSLMSLPRTPLCKVPIKSKYLRDSEEERDEPQRLLC